MTLTTPDRTFLPFRDSRELQIEAGMNDGGHQLTAGPNSSGVLMC